MSGYQCDHEAGTSRCKKHLLESRASTSNHTAAYNGSRRKTEIELVEERLRVLEEEAEMLKEALSESMEERTKLMSEINEQLSTLQHLLVQREPNRGELYGQGFQIISLLKERKRAGLLQILCQESNPSIIKKGLRAKAL